MKTLLAILAGAAAVLGCRADHSSLDVQLPGTPVAVAEIRVSPPPAPAHEYYSGYADPTRLVLRSTEEWADAWATIHEGQEPLPPLPPVDFVTDMVLLAATGTRQSGGFDVTITNAALDAGTLRVGVVETTPGRGCAVATVITRPVTAARVARHEGPVEFVDRTVAIRCE